MLNNCVLKRAGGVGCLYLQLLGRLRQEGPELKASLGITAVFRLLRWRYSSVVEWFPSMWEAEAEAVSLFLSTTKKGQDVE